MTSATPKRRGNLLLSALFMAAFLFFLSVALVVTNREDIQYTLFVDHKMRASLAAEGMLDYSLTVMRNTSDWESLIQTWRPSFASGAVGEVKVQPWTGSATPNNTSRYSFPKANSAPSGVELIASASSGLFHSERHMLLEEFRFADSLLDGGAKPHLFALTGNNLQVLTPSFSWEVVGATPTTPLPGTVSAGGEALHYLAEGQGSKPPVIEDFSKTTVGGIALPGASMTSDGLPQIPVGHGGSVLALKDNKWEWATLPDPGDQLGTIVQPTVLPDDGRESATGWDKLTLDWDTIARSPSDLTVPYEYFNGPKIEWYSLTGTRAEFFNGTYTCHGIHYFYSGFRFKNSQTPNGQVHSQGTDPSLFKEPCLLQYNEKSKKWSILIDFLKVDPDPLQEPTIVPGTRPDPNTLLVTAGPRVYSKQAGATDDAWYEVQKEQLSLSGLPKRPTLFAFGEEFLYCDPRRTSLNIQPPLMALNQHDIAPYFPEFLPVLNPAALWDAKQDFAGEQEPPIYLNWSVLENSLTGFNQDLFCVVKLVSAITPPSGGQPITSDSSGLAHFDGQRWQILPAGLGFLLPATSSYRRELMLDYAGGSGPAVAAIKMVLGGYPSEKPLLRRYVPVARWGPG